MCLDPNFKINTFFWNMCRVMETRTFLSHALKNRRTTMGKSSIMDLWVCAIFNKNYISTRVTSEELDRQKRDGKLVLTATKDFAGRQSHFADNLPSKSLLLTSGLPVDPWPSASSSLYTSWLFRDTLVCNCNSKVT